ncbi:UDP-N-acetylmuramate--L-alanine ligase [Candidatus Fermentibacteria bacterium]|nr:UDP-N-acetylmuramate--L-alanine ligase [Candidatus Fermentibacteria bacterium]
MSALAELLVDCGVLVTACDRVPSSRLDSLSHRGIRTWIGHDPADHLAGARTVIHTAAIGRDHPELAAARARHLGVVPRSLVLGRLSRAIRSVCVAGSHGKSTVTALVAHILVLAGREPGYLIGGVLQGQDRGGALGRGEVVVVETDEFDRSIERVAPALAVITNIEPEHLDIYGSLDRLTAAFTRYARRASGGVVVWNDGMAARAVSSLPAGRVIRCGMGSGGDVTCAVTRRFGPRFRVAIRLPDGTTIHANLALSGLHNVQNATLAAAVAWRRGVSSETIASGLETYPGLMRRFEVLGTAGESMLISDYAHHPTEIRATLATAALYGKPVVAVFQPHLHSRTALLFDDFARSFNAAARVVVTPVYAARETPLPGITGKRLAEAIRARGIPAEHAEPGDALHSLLAPLPALGVTMVFLSAGDLDGFARQFAAEECGAGG